jgi:hypothetical protein
VARLIQSSLKAAETPESKASRDNPEWDEHWIREHFYCALRCSNRACRGLVHVVGSAEPDLVQDAETGDLVVDRVLQPLFFQPAPRIIEVPEDCPGEVADQIHSAASLYWQDPAAAGNRLRKAIEHLLTAQRVPRSALKSDAGKRLSRRRRLGLDERIKRFEKRNPDLGKQFHALKWIGHEASHAEVTKRDVLDAFEILESVLHELYVPRPKLDSLVSEINRRKGPRGRRRIRTKRK